MKTAFTIMPIGDPYLDQMYAQAIELAVRNCGLDPKRVDKHNEGDLLKKEILNFVKDAEIIIADLTNERPNCYLEVGLAIGMEKLTSLILTAREDHMPERPEPHKIHFDLIGYPILFWKPDRLDEFRLSLEKRIKNRQTILGRKISAKGVSTEDIWLKTQQEMAWWGIRDCLKLSSPGSMESTFTLSDSQPNTDHMELLEALKKARFRIGGWGVGEIYPRHPDAPRPKNEGIVAEIRRPDSRSYEYWAVRANGDYYLLESLFEDVDQSSIIQFDTRIISVASMLLYCSRLYPLLGIPSTAQVTISIRHQGLKGRVMKARDNFSIIHQGPFASSEDEVSQAISVPLGEVEHNIIHNVKALTQKLFATFDFFKVPDDIYSFIVNNWLDSQR